MDDPVKLRRIARTVSVVIDHATDLPRVVDLLVAEFGFDATFCVLSDIADNPRAQQAMWLVLEAETVREATAQAGVEVSASTLGLRLRDH